MNRRDIARGLGAAVVSSSFGAAAWAQGGPVEGRDYVKIDRPAPVGAPAGKVEVVEFFGYWCPHCNAFEPSLEAWVRKLPTAQVSFRRLSIAFNPAQEPLQRLYYALESLGQVEALHRKVFAALHASRTLPFAAKESDIEAFLKANGADAAKVLEAMKGFAVSTRLRQTRQLMEAYQIDGVPTLGIQGRWRTSPSVAGSHERALAVSDALIAMARKG